MTTEHLGWAVTESLRTEGGERLVPKGGLLDEQAIERMHELPDRELHLIQIEDSDIHEDAAGRRICKVATGDGIEVDGPHHSRFNLNAKHRGLLQVDRDLVKAVNSVGQLSIFTLLDRQAVARGKTVAGVKATPIVVPRSDVEAIERIVGDAGRPVVDVLPFEPKRVFVLATEDLHPRLRDRFQEMVSHKIGWFGGSVAGVRFVDGVTDEVAAGFREGLELGADVFLAAGGNTLDPLDPIFQALPKIGAEIVHFGAPADPGSMFWVAEVGEKPIFNLASCSMYSQSTVIDLMLPISMAGIRMSPEHVIDLGYGGLLEDEMAFRFPDYDSEDE
ncbi:MAG: hypothetical protein ACOC9Y_06320 [Chloroflexota bacterium]